MGNTLSPEREVAVDWEIPHRKHLIFKAVGRIEDLGGVCGGINWYCWAKARSDLSPMESKGKHVKIGAISDTHGDTQSWERALVAFAGAKLVIHCGDILYHGPFNPILPTYAPKLLAEAMNEAPFPLVFAKGNCDSEVDQMALSFPIQQPMALVDASGVTVLVTHGDKYDESGLSELGRKYGVDIVVRGHTHERTIKKVDGLVILNPGSASLPKDGPPTVAIIDTELRRVSILSLEDRSVLVEEAF